MHDIPKNLLKLGSDSGVVTPPGQNPEPQELEPISFSASGGLATRLAKAGVSFVFSSYQCGGLFLVGCNADGGLNVHQTGIVHPMGIATRPEGGFFLSARAEIQQFSSGITAEQRVNRIFDACYAPRVVHVTGALDAHDVGICADGKPIFVNTRYNCLAKPDPVHSFAPVWRPPFISALVAEDRCHLNGLAMRDGKPAYVTAISKSDTIDGWRDRRSTGGIIIDVEVNEIIATGLSMPHSPRWYQGKLWVLNSGTGELGTVATEGEARGTFTPLTFCPGFARGLAFHDGFAFLGLSKPRYQRFEGLDLDQRLQDKDSEPWCGVQIISLSTGQCVDWFRLDGGIQELYDVGVLTGVNCPMAIGLGASEIFNYITVAGA